MNTASISALHHLVSQVVGRKTQEEASTDAFAVPVAPASPVPAVDAVSENTRDSSKDSTFDEAFAKLLVNLKASTQATDAQAAFSPLAVDTSIAARDSAVTSEADVAAATSSTSTSSAQQQFMDFMNLSPAEQMREKLTGVSKEEYEAMSPEQKLSVDNKLQAALKEQQQTATADINGKILAARLALV
ncbi:MULTISPECIES: hypothetical protein [Pseudomonas]|jgi:hypothetical protein|uniref:Uncharacterized protein n=1 Tax=Pseudomonas syringae TaxID=317 RepID=A0A085V5N1_PSESX|nr:MULTISPECIES: hypothetical protein [Pseudomonas]EPJ76656.1 hypothetical protein CFII64_26143 [Pseudomonas sp. CFII64]KFE50744.1 hypothetical protein IV02_15060 [Pseudomonas syringae]